MKLLRIIITVLCLTSLTKEVKGQNYFIDSILLKKYSSAELLTDLEFIKEKILTKKYNRTPFLFLTRDKFFSCYDSVKSVISEKGNMSLKDFYFLVTPFANSICDDHLIFELFGLWGIDNNKKPRISNENIMFAASAIIFDKNIYITCSSDIPEKSLLISVNNVSASEIITEFIKYSEYPKQRYYEKYKIAPVNFSGLSLFMYAKWNFKDSITIKYQINNTNKIETKTVALKKFFDSNAVKYCYEKEKRKNIELRFEENIAILKVNTFNFKNFNNTIQLYNLIFDSIKMKRSDNLIIDISENGGGSDINWMILARYITKKQLLLNCKGKPLLISDALNEYKIDQSTIDTTNFFNGKIFLITGSKTFSSAVHFADAAKTNGLCEKIFGQVTLGQATHYGEATDYFLPNTKLHVRVSSKLFPSITCKINKNGVIPDVSISENSLEDYLNNNNETTIRKVLEIIK